MKTNYSHVRVFVSCCIFHMIFEAQERLGVQYKTVVCNM